MSILTLRPNSDVSISWVQTSPASPTNHYSKIAEASADGYTTFNGLGRTGTSTTWYDVFGMSNHSAESGPISNVRLVVCTNSM